LQSSDIGLFAEVAQMAVEPFSRDEELTSLDRSCNRLDDVGRPWTAVQPSLRGGIGEVEMYPDEICSTRRSVDLRESARRLPLAAAECKGEQWTIVTHALSPLHY
jgi:hypothetical protein